MKTTTVAEKAQLSTPAILNVKWRASKNDERSAPVSPELLDKEIYLAHPFRVGHQYPKRRNYTGEHWFSNTSTHVWFESLFERQALLWLDFTSDIVAISTQPMRMNFASGLHHIPDIFALHSDYRQIVYDVKPARLITATVRTQFDATREVCEQVGWGYEVISSFDGMAAGNLTWLANFRQTHFTPPSDARTSLINALAEPLPSADAVEVLRSDYATVAAARGWLYHLAWAGEVSLDLATPFSDSTLVSKAPSC
jgi:hypothetical protein